MTSLNNNDIQEACVKINTIIEELAKYLSDPRNLIRAWFQRKNFLKSFLNQKQVITTAYGGIKETHFTSCVWARPGIRDGPDECDCYFVQEEIKHANEIYNIITS